MAQPYTRTSTSTADRWEQLKPTIQRLYLNEKRKLEDLIAEMRRHHDFDAGLNQYKYQFRKWGWKRNIPKAKKDAMVEQHLTRARAGKSGTNLTFKGREVENHKLRRHMKEVARMETQYLTLDRSPLNVSRSTGAPVLSFVNSIFLNWNLPYAAMRHALVRPFDHTSPFANSVPTPGSEIAVTTPCSAPSPQNAPSPTALVVKEKSKIDRAQLFAHGQHSKLLTSMNEEERRDMSEWLYQYWFFCFKTAKHWGKGPTAWTAELLDFASFPSNVYRSLPSTPRDAAMRLETVPHDIAPTDLCRWHIHVASIPHYEALPEQFPQPDAQFHLDDESPWPPWSPSQHEPSLSTRLRDAIEHNDFSPIPTASLPVAIPQIAKAAQRSQDELLLEALGFSIMSRNIDQVGATLRDLMEGGIDTAPIFPFHMATSYLDGWKSCCHIFGELSMSIRGISTFVDENNHTVLENLMIAILKSHSSVKPGDVNHMLRDNQRFSGEEVDICGRWDADSPCIRHLLTNGDSSVPTAWKHKFCHTSVQTICHCIQIMFRNLGPESQLPLSGLYVEQCFGCGERLKLKSLHSLVVTAYHLARNACKDEDLFGMIALLLCLLSCSLDPLQTASISVTAITQAEVREDECEHTDLTAASLAEKLSADPKTRTWNKKLRVGWEVFCGILRVCEDACTSQMGVEDDDLMDMDTGYDQEAGDLNQAPGSLKKLHWFFSDYPEYIPQCFRQRTDLPKLWAAIQAELLSYRRLHEGADWISDRFSMTDLHEQLASDMEIAVAYETEGHLQPHCACGNFKRYPIAVLADATDPNLSNLDHKDAWNRATYGDVPQFDE